MNHGLQLCRQCEVIDWGREDHNVSGQNLRIDLLHIVLLNTNAFFSAPTVFAGHAAPDVLMGDIEGDDFVSGFSRTFRKSVYHLRCGPIQMGAAVQDQYFHTLLPSPDRDRHVAATKQFRHLLSALVCDMAESGISPGV